VIKLLIISGVSKALTQLVLKRFEQTFQQ